MAQQQLSQYFQFTIINSASEIGTAESFVLIHPLLKSTTLQEVMVCFIRFLLVMGFNIEDIRQVFSKIDDLIVIREETQSREFFSVDDNKEKNKSETKQFIEEKLKDQERINNFLKQIEEKPEFAKKIFRLFLEDIMSEE